MSDTPPPKRSSLKTRLGIAVAGLLFIGIAAGADRLGLDYTPGFGLFQTLGLLLGITLVALAAFMMAARREPAGAKLSLTSDVGVRLGLTGLLTCYVAGLADMLGVGTHRGAAFERPFLGPLQLTGLLLGLLVVAAGLLLFWLGFRPPVREE